MVVADGSHSLQITGNGDVLEPFDGIIGALVASASLASAPRPEGAPHPPRAAIGSGSAYAGAAARALKSLDDPKLDALTIGAPSACRPAGAHAGPGAAALTQGCARGRSQQGDEDRSGCVHLHKPQLHGGDDQHQQRGREGVRRGAEGHHRAVIDDRIVIIVI